MNTTTLEQTRRPPTSQQLAPVIPGFGTLESFELMQRGARLLASGTLVPSAYRLVIEKYDRYGNVTESRENPAALSNCVVALNMAIRMNADPVMVMQNLHIIEGRPSWSSPWIIAQINNCGRFSPLRFEMKQLGTRVVEHVSFEWSGPQGNRQRHEVKTSVEIQDVQCIAWVIEKGSGERLVSSPISIGLAVMEGWYTKNGSKWKTMPDQMLRYRSAAFFGRIYAPELLMGLPAVEELEDTIIDVEKQPDGKYAANVDALRQQGDSQRPAGEEPAHARTDTQGATTVESKDIPPAESKSAPASAAATPAPASAPAPTPSPAAQTPASAIGTEFDRPGQAGELFSGSGPQYTDEDTLEMAIEFASKGDYDSALDLKLNLPDQMKKRIDAAIQSHKDEVAMQSAKQTGAKQGQAERPRRSYNV
ncbi:hypothetical protein [Paraburkholderia dipogonis]|uniref:hypothetical protein n=1 Tax=Paraburkholderia dipogonis TaxID=1211383 RepID=UPI0038B71167